MSEQAEKRITLYTHLVELALAEAGVEYDSHIIDLIRKPDWYIRAVNPAGRVCLHLFKWWLDTERLLTGPGVILAESLVILSFLADVYTGLLPATPIDRARARFFITRVQEKFVPVWFGAITTGEVGLERLVEALEDVQELLPDVDVRSEGESKVAGVHAVPFVKGGGQEKRREGTVNWVDQKEERGYAAGRWSIADASISPFLYLTEVYLRNDVGAYPPGTGPTVWSGVFEGEKFKRLQAYYKRCSGRKSWGVMTDERYMLAFLPKFMTYMGVRRKETRT